MTADFPTTLHTFTDTSCSETRTISQVTNEAQAEIGALETKVGVDGSSVTASHDYKLSDITGTNKAAGETLPKLNGNVALTATSTELNQLDGVTVGGLSNSDIPTIGTHPFVRKTNNVYALGDSLTGAYIYEAQLSSLLDDYWNPVWSKGIGGLTTGSLVGLLNAFVLDNEMGAPNYVIVWAGINDILTSVAEATIKANLQSLYTSIHNAGAKVVAVYLSPFKNYTSWDAGKQTVLDNINTWIAGTATNIDYKVNVYSVLEDPGAADALLAAYDSGDGLHLSTAGYNLVGTTIYNTVTWAKTTDIGTLDLTTYNDLVTADSFYRQAIINGNFDIWQRGTSSTSAAGSFYTADRYIRYDDPDGGSLPTVTTSRQLMTQDGVRGARYCLRMAPNGAGSSLGVSTQGTLSQRIENGTMLLCGAGRKITVSFWARSDLANKKIGISLSQTYGTGGTPTGAEPIYGTNFTLSANWEKYSYTFTTYATGGKTFGSNNDDFLALIFWIAWGSTTKTYVGAGSAETFGGSGYIDISQVQVCAGTEALPFMPKSYAEEMRLCQRYLTDLTGNVSTQYIAPFAAYASSSTNMYMVAQLPVEMRTAPTLVALTAANFYTGYSADGNIALTALAIQLATPRNVLFYATVAAGLTAGRGSSIFRNNTTERILLTAEI